MDDRWAEEIWNYKQEKKQRKKGTDARKTADLTQLDFTNELFAKSKLSFALIIEEIHTV